jgi:hypothetical protein
MVFTTLVRLINMKGLYFFLGCHHSIVLTALADTAFATWSENRAPITSLIARPTNIEDFALYPTPLNVHDCGQCARRRSTQGSRHTAPRKQASTAKTTQSTDIFLRMARPIRLLRSHISLHKCVLCMHNGCPLYLAATPSETTIRIMECDTDCRDLRIPCRTFHRNGYGGKV